MDKIKLKKKNTRKCYDEKYTSLKYVLNILFLIFLNFYYKLSLILFIF